MDNLDGNIKAVSSSIKNAVIDCLEIVKDNISQMDDMKVLKAMMNVPDNVVLCGECKKCKSNSCPMKYIKITPTDYCSFGEKRG